MHGTDSRGSLHAKIDHLLTEARVVLPGAQALLGFQFIVTLTETFSTLPTTWQVSHFGALALIAIAVVLLISPAAVHRIAFAGEDDERFLSIGSRIVTLALIPLALGLAADLAVAGFLLFQRSSVAIAIAAGAASTLLALWYVLPWRISKRGGGARRAQADAP
jgi:Family of unknown function (DUF6328)